MHYLVGKSRFFNYQPVNVGTLELPKWKLNRYKYFVYPMLMTSPWKSERIAYLQIYVHAYTKEVHLFLFFFQVCGCIRKNKYTEVVFSDNSATNSRLLQTTK